MKRIYGAAFIGLWALAGCSSEQIREDNITREVQQSVADAEAKGRESRTLSSLAKIEESIAAYVNTEKQIPKTLDDLVPKYLAEIPSLEIDVRGHPETTKVRVYPADILRDGQIDGTRLKDTGRWGYVHNDRQVVVFIDCTHRSKRGHPWYQQKGVY